MALSPVEEFENACRDWGYGPRLSRIPIVNSEILKTQRKFAAKQISVLQTQIPKERTIDIHFDYVDSGAMQAVAEVRNFIGLIGVCTGAIFLPMDTICRMLAHPDVLPALGDRRKESVRIHHSEGMYSNFERLVEHRTFSAYIADPDGIPLDDTRREFASFASQLAQDFLVLHELAHVVLGHCEWLPTQGTPLILEVTSYESPSAAIARQAIEMDADLFAVSITIDRLVKMQIPNEYMGFGANVEQRLLCWCFGLYVFFRHWGIDVDQTQLLKLGHPPPVMRFVIALICAHETLKILGHGAANNFKPICRHAMESVEFAISKIGGTAMTREKADALADPAIDDHHRVLRAKLLSLMPDLQRYSHLL